MSESAQQKIALMVALRDALDGLQEMIGYVPPYFIYKWDLNSYITRADEALRAAEYE
jgi:hypothetical protein